MNQNQIVTAHNVTLTNCDKEQIHIPSSIQPHGLIFILKEPHFKILQTSLNTFEFIGIHPQNLLNKSLKDILGESQFEAIKQCLIKDFENVNPLEIIINNDNNTQSFDAIINRINGLIVLELEPRQNQKNTNFFSFYQMTRGTINKIQKAFDLQELSNIIVREIRNLTGFDRVMVYRFDQDESGVVIAEDKNENLISFLGLHYPASDIPQPARRLYKLNLLRLIPDIYYQPVELPNNPETNQPFDLSFSVLRSVSPIHIEYLKNMGVRASMSISLIQDQKLWGLIACHHYFPKYVPYGIRIACEFLGQVMSLQLAAQEESGDLDYQIKLKSIQTKIIDALSQEDDFVDGLVKDREALLDVVSAQGVAVCTNSQLTLIGKTPNESDVQNLIEWVENQIENGIFYTDCLVKHYPLATNFLEVASGVLAISLTRIKKNYILWFRSEVLQTVNWAGNPNKSIKVEEDGSLTLSPRKSFDLWKETVRFKSFPWKKCEIEGAIELRSAIVAIVLRKADELAQLNLELQRSNTELDAFTYIASHDLKEPLRGIHNYSNFLLEDYAEILDAEGSEKLHTLVRLTQRMEELINALLRYSRLGRNELAIKPTNLKKSIENIQEVFKVSQKNSNINIHIPRPLPIVECDPILIEEVFSNLINNAIKYNDKPEKWVEIGWLDPSDVVKLNDAETDSSIVFYVKDNGIGIREQHLDTIFRIFKRLHAPSKYGGGTGAGLTIVKKIIERHGGTIWIESTYSEGSTFYFTLN